MVSGRSANRTQTDGSGYMQQHISVIHNDNSIHEESAESAGQASSQAPNTSRYLKNLHYIDNVSS